MNTLVEKQYEEQKTLLTNLFRSLGETTQVTQQLEALLQSVCEQVAAGDANIRQICISLKQAQENQQILLQQQQHSSRLRPSRPNCPSLQQERSSPGWMPNGCNSRPSGRGFCRLQRSHGIKKTGSRHEWRAWLLPTGRTNPSNHTGIDPRESSTSGRVPSHHLQEIFRVFGEREFSSSL